MSLLIKLEEIKNRWKDLEMQLSDPGVVADMKRFKEVVTPFTMHSLAEGIDKIVTFEKDE